MDLPTQAAQKHVALLLEILLSLSVEHFLQAFVVSDCC